MFSQIHIRCRFRAGNFLTPVPNTDFGLGRIGDEMVLTDTHAANLNPTSYALKPFFAERSHQMVPRAVRPAKASARRWTEGGGKGFNNDCSNRFRPHAFGWVLQHLTHPAKSAQQRSPTATRKFSGNARLAGSQGQTRAAIQTAGEWERTVGGWWLIRFHGLAIPGVKITGGGPISEARTVAIYRDNCGLGPGGYRLPALPHRSCAAAISVP